MKERRPSGRPATDLLGAEAILDRGGLGSKTAVWVNLRDRRRQTERIPKNLLSNPDPATH